MAKNKDCNQTLYLGQISLRRLHMVEPCMNSYENKQHSLNICVLYLLSQRSNTKTLDITCYLISCGLIGIKSK